MLGLITAKSYDFTDVTVFFFVVKQKLMPKKKDELLIREAQNI